MNREFVLHRYGVTIWKREEKFEAELQPQVAPWEIQVRFDPPSVEKLSPEQAAYAEELAWRG